MHTTPPGSPARPARLRNPRGQGTRLRAEIVRAAAALLERTGSEDAVTLRAVARGIGVTAPSLYGHFADREAIRDAVVEEAFGELTDVVRAAADRQPDPVERLRGVCRAYVQFAEEHPQRYRVLFGRSRAADRDTTTEEPRDMDDLHGAEAFGTLVGALAACVEAGTSASRDPLRDATALWVSLHGYATLRASVPRFPWPERDDLLTTLVDRLARLT